MTFRIVLISLSFIEGACVMASELFGAKLIAPFFGGSLYVWAGVLGVTMFALMSGYYIGGIISEKLKSNLTLFWVLLFAGLFLIIMPFTSQMIMTKTIYLSIKWGTVISLLVFLFPPLFFMGMTSPIIISNLNSKVETSGKIAGSIYAISTLGGIISTFLVGFYLLPEFGIKWPCVFFGGLLIVPSLIFILYKKKFGSIFIVVLFLIVPFSQINNNPKSELVKVLHESEGILGQIKVIDMPYYSQQRGWKNGRALMVNNTIQTIANADNLNYDLWDASIFFPACVSMFEPNSDALLLGLGGGTILHQFNRLNFNVDVIEIDERIKNIAIEFFGVSENENIIIDDARHYINVCQKKYDIVTLDLFLNETPPAHVLSIESFSKIKTLLTENGILMINFFGFISGDLGRAARSIFLTLNYAGFYTDILATSDDEATRNLIFLAQKSKIDFDNVNYGEPGLDSLQNLTPFLLDKEKINFDDAISLSDIYPALETIYLSAALKWRSSTIAYNIIPYL